MLIVLDIILTLTFKTFSKKSLQLTFYFVRSVPEIYDQLFELFADKTNEQISVIIERMIKCNHPSLDEKNKDELNKLFAFLLQFLNDCDHLVCINCLIDF